MGWTFGYKPDDVREHLKALHTHETDRTSYRCMDIAMSLNVAYAAVEMIDLQADARTVFCSIVLMKYIKNGGPEEWGYKSMDESWVPVHARCPERILDLLTPTDNKNANVWRTRCREALARARMCRRLRQGAVIEFERPIPFEDGFEGARFIIEKHRRSVRTNRRSTLFRASNGRLYRIRRFKERADWRVIEPPGELGGAA